jgi:uncharacterized protein YbjT (DUF2867 family)
MRDAVAMPARILVVTATGDLGRRVVDALAAAGASVRAGVRRPDADHDVPVGVEVVGCDLTDPGTLSAACDGVDTVVVTASAIGRALAGSGDSLDAVDRRGVLALVDAAEHAGVERFVYTSYAGVGAGLGFPLERIKLAVEARLAASRMRRVIVRPDAFQEVHLTEVARFDLANGRASVFGRGDLPHRWVSTGDTARLIAAVATEADPPAMVEFGGPEDISKNELIAMAEQLTGRDIKVQRMPALAARLLMRLLARPKPALASVFGTGLLTDLVPAAWDDEPLRSRGIEPTAASEFIAAQVQTNP